MENNCSIIFSVDHFSSDRIHLVCHSLICMHVQNADRKEVYFEANRHQILWTLQHTGWEVFYPVTVFIIKNTYLEEWNF